MPGLNGTGPLGRGPRTGWGFGRCRSESQPEPDTTPPDDDHPPAWFWRRGGARPWGWRWRGGQGRGIGWRWRGEDS